jgi:hypothetical protein
VALAVLDQLLDSLHDFLLEFLWDFLTLEGVVADIMIIITKNSRSSGIFYNYDSQ